MSKAAKELGQIQTTIEEIVKSTLLALSIAGNVSLPKDIILDEDLESTEDETKTVLITPKEAMKVLGVGWNCMYENLLKRKDFPCFKIGAKYFINRELLQVWADKQCLRNK